MTDPIFEPSPDDPANHDFADNSSSPKLDFWENDYTTDDGTEPVLAAVPEPEPIAAEPVTDSEFFPEESFEAHTDDKQIDEFLANSMTSELLPEQEQFGVNPIGSEILTDVTQMTVDPVSDDSSTVEGDPNPGFAETDANTDEPQIESDKVNQVEMRQVAGLAAGSSMNLAEGTFNFREGDKEIAFTITVDSEGLATVTPGASEVWVDDTLVTGPTSLTISVLNVGSARFTVRPSRVEYGPYSTEIEPKERAIITVPDFKEQKATWQPGKSTELKDTSPSGEAWDFIEQVRSARDEDSRLQRLLHPDPEELSYRISQGGFGLLNRAVDHPFFSRFSIAYGPIPWIPRFDDNSKIPIKLHANIDELCSLRSVPITANLTNGPLGITGPRQAVLACVRHAIMSLASLHEPGSVELKVITTDKTHNSNWHWLNSLPSWISSNDNTFRIIVADGMRSFELAGLDEEQAKNREIGLIVIGESLREMPSYCSTVLQVSQDGYCRATNRRGESLEGTPIGIGEGFAAETATKLAQLRPEV